MDTAELMEAVAEVERSLSSIPAAEERGEPHPPGSPTDQHDEETSESDLESSDGLASWDGMSLEEFLGSSSDLDAALKETVCSPARIAFAASSLKNTGLADLSLPLLFKIGAIDIDIVETE